MRKLKNGWGGGRGRGERQIMRRMEEIGSIHRERSTGGKGDGIE